MIESGIFISYRREDSSGHAGRLYDALNAHFGENVVFMDIDTIEPGVDYGEVIDRAVGSCKVLIALIGPEWLMVTDDRGIRRLDNPEDFVRMEIARGLKRRNVRVVPVLVQGARIPDKDQLPDDLSALARRNALELSDVRWQYDVGRLIRTLERVMQEPSGPRTEPPAPPKESRQRAMGDEAVEPRVSGEATTAATKVARRRLGFPLSSTWLGVAALAIVGIATFVVLRSIGQDGNAGGGGDGNDVDPVARLAGTTIAFVSDTSGSCEIHLLTVGEGDSQQLTHSGANNLRPDWSSDGEQLIYASDRDGDYDLYVVDLGDGSETKLLELEGDQKGPDWSIQDEIVFSSAVGDSSEIEVLEADSDEPQQITDYNAHSVAPDVSPDGNAIVFASNFDNERGESDIHVIETDGKVRNLTVEMFGGEPSNEFEPEWSPDGSRIIFAAKRAGEDYDIWAMNATGDDKANLTAHSGDDRHGSWSFDGSAIVFGSNRDVPEGDTESGCAADEGQQDLFVMNADGSGQQRLTAIEADDSIPAWSPRS